MAKGALAGVAAGAALVAAVAVATSLSLPPPVAGMDAPEAPIAKTPSGTVTSTEAPSVVTVTTTQAEPNVTVTTTGTGGEPQGAGTLTAEEVSPVEPNAAPPAGEVPEPAPTRVLPEDDPAPPSAPGASPAAITTPPAAAPTLDSSSSPAPAATDGVGLPEPAATAPAATEATRRPRIALVPEDEVIVAPPVAPREPKPAPVEPEPLEPEPDFPQPRRIVLDSEREQEAAEE